MYGWAFLPSVPDYPLCRSEYIFGLFKTCKLGITLHSEHFALVVNRFVVCQKVLIQPFLVKTPSFDLSFTISIILFINLAMVMRLDMSYQPIKFNDF